MRLDRQLLWKRGDTSRRPRARAPVPSESRLLGQVVTGNNRP
jgi:hypothetical protein